MRPWRSYDSSRRPDAMEDWKSNAPIKSDARQALLLGRVEHDRGTRCQRAKDLQATTLI